MIEQAWAAGFFDGEGNVSYVKTAGRTPRVYAQLSQVHREPLDRFREAVAEIGSVRGPYKQKAANHSPYFTWSAEGIRSVTAVFLAIGPHLSEVKHAAFTSALRQHETWCNAAICEIHIIQMSVDKRGGYFCHECKSSAGRKAADVRWHSA